MPVIYKTPTAVSVTPTPDSTKSWTNITNVFTSNNQTANILFNNPAGEQSEYLYCHDYGFDIPNGSVINGIEVRIKKSTSFGNLVDAIIRLGLNDSTLFNAKQGIGYWPPSSTTQYGNAFDLWGKAWKISEINSSGFGAAFAVNGIGNAGGGVDVIEIGIHYTTYTSVFQTHWDTLNSGNPNEIKLPLVPSGTYNFTVNWGDGSSNNITSYYAPEITHTYVSSGVKTIEITGIIIGWSFGITPDDKLKITEVLNWGPLKFTSLENCFDGCSNLTISANDSLNIETSHSSIKQSFRNCSSLTSFPIINSKRIVNFEETWANCSNLVTFPLIDTSDGTNFELTWNQCSSLTNFPKIDTSNGIDFTSAWRDCHSLTTFPELNTSEGTNFTATWMGCYGLTSFPMIDLSKGTSFNDTWNACINLTSFPLLDLSSGTMFSGTWDTCSNLISFPPLDVSSGITFQRTWADCQDLVNFPILELQNGTNFVSAFYGCLSLRELPIGFGLKLTSVQQADLMFGLTTLNSSAYSRLLQELNTAITFNNFIQFSGGNAKYFKFALSSRQNLVNVRLWTITDGGLIAETYHQVASGGAKLSGIALKVGATHDQISSGGANLSGSSTNTYDEISSGGVTLSGIAEKNFGAYFENTGIVIAGGTSLINSIYVESNSLNVLISGTAEVELLIVATGGIQAGSSTDLSLEYNIFSSGGLRVGGISKIELIVTQEVSGEVKANGSAFVENSYPMQGGSVCSGNAVASKITSWTPTGGIISDGYAFINPYLPTGGCKLNGTAIITTVHNSIFNDGGMTLGGQSLLPIIEIANGGAELSGFADIYRSITIPDWSVDLNGSKAIPVSATSAIGHADFWYNPTNKLITWNITYSGFSANISNILIKNSINDSLEIYVLSHSSSNSSPIRGEDTLFTNQANRLLDGQWYIEIIDDNNEKIRSKIEHYGMSIGGKAVVKPYYEITTGGMSCGGEAVVSPIIATGGMVAKGRAIISSSESRTSNGGVVVGGAALKFIPDIETTGGCVAGGISTNRQNAFNIASGGMSVGGKPILQILSPVKGGTTVGGSASVEFIFTIPTTGGTVTSGESPYDYTYNHVSTGGLISTGLALTLQKYYLIASGGMVTNGILERKIIYGPSMNGGIVVSGQHVQTFRNTYILKGGALVSGKATAERLKKSYESVTKRGYCRALYSYNICKDTIDLREKLIVPLGSTLQRDVIPSDYRIHHFPTWCDADNQKSDCDASVPAIINNRQNGIMPPKDGRSSVANNGIASLS